MLTSQAWRRLAQKTSAMGLMGTLAVFVGSVVGLSSPAQAAMVDPLKITYNCTGGLFATGPVIVTITPPASVEPAKSASIEWTFPAIQVTKALTAGQTVTTSGGDLGVTGGTPQTLKGSGTGTTTVVQANTTFTPPKMTASVSVTATTGGTLVLTPVATPTGTTPLLSIKVGEELTTCTYTSTSPANLSIPVQTGGGGAGGDVVTYSCDLVDTTQNDPSYPAAVDVKFKFSPVMPTNAKANTESTIAWTTTVDTSGEPLMAPTGFPATGGKYFITVKASGAGVTAPPVAEAALTNVVAGQEITNLAAPSVKIKPTTTGTVTLTPGDIVFGTSATQTTGAAIKCLAPTSGLKTYTFTVAAGTTPSSSSTPSPTPTTTSPKPTKTSTATVTVTPSNKSKTPKAGADTGAGGDAGPDGRMFILTGGALIVAAAAGGLVMRRRTVTRG